ncbi:MAG TPA: phosphopantetheine-binding protein [Casimicrobiaceae bacterium]
MTPAPRPALDTAFVAPRDALEECVARLWEEVLRHAPLGTADDFFDLGGESLQAFALIARVRDAFGVQLTPRDLFAAGTIAGMAGLIRERAPPR